jgi:predicted metalloprotease with PDZ domain
MRLTLLATALTLAPASPRTPTVAPTAVDYALTVNSAGTSVINVALTVHGAPAEFRVAMATHAELDDQYWRYMTDVGVKSGRGAASIVREDSALWRVTAPPGDVTISYRVNLPSSPQQGSWRAHLTPSGGLIGGPHSFMYVVDGEHAGTTVTLRLPSGWTAATGLRSNGPHIFSAPNVEALLDSPILVGTLRSWRFDVDRVRHDIAFLGRAGGATFDTSLFVANVERIARETVRMFGRMPYDRFQFLFEDSTFGGLEHLNSVSIGVRSAGLATNPNSLLTQIAHEYFHTWNEVHLRPEAWIGVRHERPAPTGELWFSEGVTLYYADLLLRRAGLATPERTRVEHLERMISTYLANPSHAMVSPEQTSRAFNLMGTTGDFTPNMFIQGELLGVVLDLMIREGSAGRRTLDDVMRALSAQFSVSRGFTGNDVESAVAAACVCDPHAFFEQNVRSARALDFDRSLAVLGLRMEVTWSAARTAEGTPQPDLRITSYATPGDSSPRLIIQFPGTVWGRAGLHTGDRLVSWDGKSVTDPSQLRQALGLVHIGDTIQVEVQRNGQPFRAAVNVTGFERPTVRLTALPSATTSQRERLTRWMSGR